MARSVVVNRSRLGRLSRSDFLIGKPTAGGPRFGSELGSGSGSGSGSRSGSRSGWRSALVLATVLLWLSAEVAGHAALVSVRTVQGFEIHASYDTGEPMVGAQVTVFEPEDPMRGQRLGLTDDRGFFRFVPTSEQAGLWSIQVRQAGHGAMTHFERSATSDLAAVDAPPVWLATASGPDPWQRLIMAVAVVWGFVGTALYFRSRQRQRAPS